MDVLVSDRQTRWPASARILGAMTRRVVRTEDPDVAEVSVVIAGDELLRSLNHTYRGQDRPTDVLSFEADTPGPRRHLGEVVISADRAVAQAPRYGHAVADEVTRLLVHGLLHLHGYEHDTSSGGRAMRAREAHHVTALTPWTRKLRARYGRDPR